jgi:hypothetical protein
LKVPRLRSLPFETQIIERYKRRESSVEESLIEMYLAGVSVRRVEDITEALWGTKVSPSTVSELNQKVYKQIDEWRNKPIQGKHPYVYLDGTYLKRSWGGEVKNVAILVAIGVAEDGYREVLGIAHAGMNVVDQPPTRGNCCRPAGRPRRVDPFRAFRRHVRSGAGQRRRLGSTSADPPDAVRRPVRNLPDKESPMSPKARATLCFLAATHGSGKQNELATDLMVSPARITQMKAELACALATDGYHSPLGRRPRQA